MESSEAQAQTTTNIVKSEIGGVPTDESSVSGIIRVNEVFVNHRTFFYQLS
jgi:hypothetical protein